eukprot:153686-Pyramimonas_sp.AAC.3
MASQWLNGQLSRLWRFFGVRTCLGEQSNSPVAERLNKGLMAVPSPTWYHRTSSSGSGLPKKPPTSAPLKVRPLQQTPKHAQIR